MDQALVAIAEAAERDQQVPRLALVTSSAVVFGLPISSTDYLVRMRPSLATSHLANLKANERVRRRDREDATRRAEEWADHDLRSFGGALDGPAGAISLGDVSLAIGSETVSAAAIRVPFEAVSAWFMGSFEAKEAKGGGWFVGGMVPLDLGD